MKFLHTGDVHLDCPFSGIGAERADARRNEQRAAFTSMMTYVRTSGVDLVLIAGDLFDRAFATRETVALLRGEFERLGDIPVVISPGNHDPFTPDSVWAKTSWPKNVAIFSSEELGRYELPQLGVDVYGYAFTGDELRECPFEGRRPARSDRINLLCAHCDTLSPLSPYCPTTPAVIAGFGADYAALGHIHTAGDIARIGNAHYGYCGCLEGHDFGERGPKGAIVAEIEKRGAECDLKIRRVRFSKRRYEILEVAADGAETTEDVARAIEAAVRAAGYGDDVIARVVLTGAVSPMLTLDTAALTAARFGLYSLEVRDETSPLWGAEYLARDPSIRGEFYRVLAPFIENGTPKERVTAIEALRLGLRAL